MTCCWSIHYLFFILTLLFSSPCFCCYLAAKYSFYLCPQCIPFPLQLSALLSDVGLNIREAHVFSTTDGYSLDVFVVDGWHSEVSSLSLSSL